MRVPMLDVWVRRKDMTTAACEAAAVAGPVFLLWVCLAALADSNAPIDVAMGDLSAAFGILLFALPIGFLIALIPCFATAHFLLSTARLGDGSLNPVAWLWVGASVAAAIGYGFDGDSGAFVMGLTGASLALFARKRALGRAVEAR